MKLAENHYEAEGKPAPGEVQLTESEAEEKWKRDRPDDYPTNPRVDRIERCSKCNSIVAVPDAVFCTNCGAIPMKKPSA